nr:uncharacterized protein LOC111503176 [Leptinotarsa decemlineata]
MSTKKTEGDLGKHYERDISTLIAMKCLLKNDIQDFWLSTNHSKIDKFDDLILFVEYKDERKELFFMQLKYKKDKNKTIAIEHFKEKRSVFYLETFKKAYESIMEKKTFFSKNKIPEDTKMFFVLFSNCKVEKYSRESSNMGFELINKTDFRSFISSNASEEISAAYVIQDKETSKEFLKRFYFYADQLNSSTVSSEIQRFTGLYPESVANILKYFYDFSDSKNTIEKLHKLDIKTKLLGYIFGEFDSPKKCSETLSILTIMNTFDVTLINQEYSRIVVWNEILNTMREVYELESLDLDDWEKPLPIELQDEFRKLLNLSDEVQIHTKDLYFHMVAQRMVPFYIETKNRYFETFFNELMMKLEVITILFDSKRVFEWNPQYLENRNDFNLLRNIADLDEEQYSALTKRVNISLHGKKYSPLSSFVDNDENFTKKISIDSMISLLDKNLNFGSSSREEQIYIGRKLRVPVLSEKILENGEYLFIVCGISSLEDFDSMSLQSYLDSIERGVDRMEELDYEDAFPILTITDTFDQSLINKINIILNVKYYCILQFVYNKAESGNRFILKDTNGPLEFLKPGICQNEYYCLRDDELLENNKHSKITIICNNAGMGKTVLLNHLKNKFPPTEWVVQLELGKFPKEFEKIDDFEGFIEFIRNIEMETVEDIYRSIFDLLFKYHIEHGRIVILLDDYEEVKERKLLEIFKNSISRGLKIWIVGRPLLKTELEENFGVFSMELDEFNLNDQNEFFKKIFGASRDKKELKRKMRLVEKIRGKLENSFIGNCQQTMMLAEVLKSNENVLGDYIRIDDLYETFMNLQLSEYNSSRKKFILRVLSKLALYSFFSERVLKKLFEWDEFECDVEMFKVETPKSKIVTELKNNVPSFSHKTYAEFLAAKFLADTVVKYMRNETLSDVPGVLKLLYCQELTNVRLFFDNLVTRNNPIHSAIINNDFSSGTILMEDNKTDILGRTIYHIMMGYGERYHIHSDSEGKQELQNCDERANIEREGNLIIIRVPKFSMKVKLDERKKELISLTSSLKLLKRDKLLENNAVQYALMSGSLEELEIAMSTGFFISSSQVREIFRNLDSDTLCFILLYCVKNSFCKIFSKVVSLRGIRDILTQIREYKTGMSLMHLALKNGNLRTVKQLVNIKSAIESWGVDKDHNTALHLACQNKNTTVLSLLYSLCEYTPSFLNLRNNRGWSHLHWFAHQGNEVWVEKILEFPSIEVDAACIQGNTPFILSILKKNLRTAELLKNKGANINIGNKNKMTALHFSASRGLYDCTEKLIQWGAKLDTKTTYGATPLIKASSWGRTKIVELLLKNGADIDSVDKNDWTSLHHAIKRKKFKVIKALVEHGANVNATTSNGHTPLITACINNVSRAVQILIKSSFSIDFSHYSESERGNALSIARKKKTQKMHFPS